MTRGEAVNWIINLSADIGKAEHYDLWHYAQALCEIREMLEGEPERKTGKWIKHKDRSCWHCSECNADDYYAYSWDCDTGEYKFQDNFCPNCGAKMEVET